MRKLAIKAATRVIKDAFIAKGAKITHTDALDLIAKLQGFEAWSHLSSVVEAAPPTPKVRVKPLEIALKDVFQGYYGNWGNCSNHPKSDWRYETENTYTTLGYWDWVASDFERALDDLVQDADHAFDAGFVDSFTVPAAKGVTLPDGTASTWEIQDNLTTCDGDVNGHDFKHKPALAILLADDELLAKLQSQMYGEDTFIVFKDGKFGTLFEFEFCSIESEINDPDGGWKPHDAVVALLLEGLRTLETSYPGVDFCVPDREHVIHDRPAVWGFVPMDTPLSDAKKEALVTHVAGL